MQLFFDLDGTLTDPKTGIVDCIRHTLRELQQPLPDEAELSSCIGPPLIESFRCLLGPDQEARAETAVEIYRARYSTKGIFEAEVIAGISEALAALSGQATAVYVVTSKLAVFAERVIAHFDLAHHFDAIYGSTLDGSLNDKADLIAHVLEAEALADRQAIMIGDRCFDIDGARANGLRSVGVLWGYGSRQELADADALCADPAELPEILRRMDDG